MSPGEKPQLSEEDRKLFKETMADDRVKPVANPAPPPPAPPSRPAAPGRGRSKARHTQPLAPDPADPSLYCAPGVPAALRRRLRDGGCAPQGKVNLHLLTAEEARLRLQPFLRNASLNNHGCVLVITGKGKHSIGGAVLRPMVEELLRNDARVRAFCPASPHHGGDGAFYVLLAGAL